MPNKNYVNGRAKEYRIVNKLKEEGYIAQRTAGSHSPYDVIAIHPDKKIVLLVQSKPESMSKKAKDDLYLNNLNKLHLNKEGIGLYMLKFILE